MNGEACAVAAVVPVVKRPPAESRGRVAGLDLLRVLAMMCVFAQHGLTVIGLIDWTWYGGICIGRFGTGMFCALSGYLAFRTAAPAPLWFAKRLRKIYPAYWLAMIAAFALSWMAAYKPFTVWQVVSQLAGTGYFTHHQELVNITSWFVSLLLLCYVLGLIARYTPQPGLLLAVYAIVAAALMAVGTERVLCQHIVEFSVAGLVALLPARRHTMWFVISGLVCLVGYPLAPHFASPGISLPLFGLALWRGWPDLKFARLIAHYLYEFYLVHGMVLVAAARLFSKQPLLTLATGAVAAITGAVLLRWMADQLVRGAAWLSKAGRQRWDARRAAGGAVPAEAHLPPSGARHALWH